MYYRIVKEHNKQLNNTIYTVEYSKDRFYGWDIMFIENDAWGIGASKPTEDVVNRVTKLVETKNTNWHKEYFHYIMNLHKNNHKTQEREIVKYFK